MMGGSVHTLHSGPIGGSDNDYKRLQRPFKNDSFATRSFQTLFLKNINFSRNKS